MILLFFLFYQMSTTAYIQTIFHLSNERDTYIKILLHLCKREQIIQPGTILNEIH